MAAPLEVSTTLVVMAVTVMVVVLILRVLLLATPVVPLVMTISALIAFVPGYYVSHLPWQSAQLSTSCLESSLPLFEPRGLPAFASQFMCSVLLLDIIFLNERLSNVMRAVVRPAYDIVATFVLMAFMVYIFANFALYQVLFRAQLHACLPHLALLVSR